MSLISFHTRKTFVHLRNTNLDTVDEIRWLSEASIEREAVQTLKVHKVPLWISRWSLTEPSDFINNIFIYVMKMNEGLTAVKQHEDHMTSARTQMWLKGAIAYRVPELFQQHPQEKSHQKQQDCEEPHIHT